MSKGCGLGEVEEQTKKWMGLDGKFNWGLNLAFWQSGLKPPNTKLEVFSEDIPHAVLWV